MSIGDGSDKPWTPPGAPPECGHKDWVLGCEKCFWEMRGVAEGLIHTEQQTAQLNGGVLMAWHVMMVTMDMTHQLVPMSQSIDLQRSALARDVIANLKQVQIYLTRLVADERKLLGAMQAAALVATEMERRAKEEQEAQQRAPAPESNIILTDRG